MAQTLPSLMRADPFTRSFCAGLDEVLAPVLLDLDCFAACLDVRTAPEDFLPWLGGWVGLDLQPGLGSRQLRTLLAAAADVHLGRGTRAGVALAVGTMFDVEVEVVESGATAYSREPGGDLPGAGGARVHVIVRPPAGRRVDVGRLAAYVASLVPVHVGVDFELRSAG